MSHYENYVGFSEAASLHCYNFATFTIQTAFVNEYKLSQVSNSLESRFEVYNLRKTNARLALELALVPRLPHVAIATNSIYLKSTIYNGHICWILYTYLLQFPAPIKSEYAINYIFACHLKWACENRFFIPFSECGTRQNCYVPILYSFRFDCSPIHTHTRKHTLFTSFRLNPIPNYSKAYMITAPSQKNTEICANSLSFVTLKFEFNKPQPAECACAYFSLSTVWMCGQRWQHYEIAKCGNGFMGLRFSPMQIFDFLLYLFISEAVLFVGKRLIILFCSRLASFNLCIKSNCSPFNSAEQLCLILYANGECSLHIICLSYMPMKTFACHSFPRQVETKENRCWKK